MEGSGSDVINYLGTIILAAGGLGVAAYGVMDGIKIVPFIGLSGYDHIVKQLGPVMAVVIRAYGEGGAKELLHAQYRAGRLEGALPRTLRQGYRIGLPTLDAAKIQEIAAFVGVADGASIAAAADKMRTGTTLSAEEREAIARFEVAVDSRIDAGLALGDFHYVCRVKIYAGVLAVVVAVIVGYVLGDQLQ